MAKDEKIAALVLILQETLEREKEREREDEAKRVVALQASSSSAPPRDLGPPPMASTPAHASASAPPMTAPPMTAPLSVTPSADDPDNFWSDQKSPDGLHHGLDSTAKTGASASLAKRVLITWDRTPGGRVKPSAPRSSGAVSFSTFLMTVRTACIKVNSRYHALPVLITACISPPNADLNRLIRAHYPASPHSLTLYSTLLPFLSSCPITARLLPGNRMVPLAPRLVFVFRRFQILLSGDI